MRHAADGTGPEGAAMRRTSNRLKLSIKLKITLWFTAFMAGIAGLCLGLLLMISGRMAQNEAVSLLSMTVRENMAKVHQGEDGRLTMDSTFSFYKNGVYLLLYNKKSALLSGQTPPDFPVDTLLENGVTKAVDGGSGQFYVFDLWLPSGWEDGLWMRGVVQKENSGQMLGTIFTLFAFILPIVILSAAFGGYLIVRRAMEPIEEITKAADSISEGRDLSRRIGLPEGEDEPGRLAGAFDRMFERLEQSFEAEKQFTSDASHELRTPTSVILAQCSYIKKYADTEEECREGVDVIERQAQRMSRLIGRLLDMTRLDFGTQKLAREEIDLSRMLLILCEEQDTKKNGISMESEIEEGLRAWVDPHLFSRAVLNLLDNARKYGRENGMIRVSLSQKGRELTLEVEDDGIGIAPEHQDKIWKRFYQVSASREGGSGLGLGLSMVQQIVRLHGGSIRVESCVEKGSRFIITLPCGIPDDLTAEKTEI